MAEEQEDMSNSTNAVNCTERKDIVVGIFRISTYDQMNDLEMQWIMRKMSPAKLALFIQMIDILKPARI